tara:strand:+ start:22 stop:261 length:240 start_codon:yes stop_codon:yes gene_type:complete
MVKFNKEDLTVWNEFRSVSKSVITHEEYKMVCRFHADYFNHPLEEPCKCAPKRIRQLIIDLDNVCEQSKRKTRKKKKEQ